MDNDSKSKLRSITSAYKTQSVHSKHIQNMRIRSNNNSQAEQQVALPYYQQQTLQGFQMQMKNKEIIKTLLQKNQFIPFKPPRRPSSAKCSVKVPDTFSQLEQIANHLYFKAQPIQDTINTNINININCYVNNYKNQSQKKIKKQKVSPFSTLYSNHPQQISKTQQNIVLRETSDLNIMNDSFSNESDNEEDIAINTLLNKTLQKNYSKKENQIQEVKAEENNHIEKIASNKQSTKSFKKTLKCVSHSQSKTISQRIPTSFIKLKPPVNLSIHQMPKKKIQNKLLINRYQIVSKLGSGSYALVKLAIDTYTEKKVALKMYIKTEEFSDNIRKQIQNEINILKLLQHENIMKLIHHIETPEHVVLVLEFKSEQTLAKMINQEPMEEDHCKRIFKQIAGAMEYCHRSGVIHRDIKLQNMMIAGNIVQIIDFGFAQESGCNLDDFIGTPVYLSPEIIQKKEYDGYKSDVWALGVCLYVMMNGIYPFKARNETDLYKKILKGDIKKSRGSNKLINLIEGMLNPEPLLRLTTKQILEHEWFK